MPESESESESCGLRECCYRHVRAAHARHLASMMASEEEEEETNCELPRFEYTSIGNEDGSEEERDGASMNGYCSEEEQEEEERGGRRGEGGVMGNGGSALLGLTTADRMMQREERAHLECLALEGRLAAAAAAGENDDAPEEILQLELEAEEKEGREEATANDNDGGGENYDATVAVTNEYDVNASSSSSGDGAGAYTALSDEDVAFIRDAMRSVDITCPEWARDISDEEWSQAVHRRSSS